MSGLLKFITCGSVDDGKSTLIGHILYDSKLLYAEQEKALELDSKVGSRGGAIDYSPVSYTHLFSTPKLTLSDARKSPYFLYIFFISTYIYVISFPLS